MLRLPPPAVAVTRQRAQQTGGAFDHAGARAQAAINTPFVDPCNQQRQAPGQDRAGSAGGAFGPGVVDRAVSRRPRAQPDYRLGEVAVCVDAIDNLKTSYRCHARA